MAEGIAVDGSVKDAMLAGFKVYVAATGSAVVAANTWATRRTAMEAKVSMVKMEIKNMSRLFNPTAGSVG